MALDYEEIMREARKGKSAPDKPRGGSSLADQVWAELAGEQIAGTPIEKVPQEYIREGGESRPTGFQGSPQPRDLGADFRRAGDIGIPIATQIGAGAIRGGPTGAVLGGLYGVGKEIAGAIGGLGLVKALGLGDPSYGDVALAGTMPVAGKAVEKTAKLIPHMMPGVSAYEQQQMIPALKESPGKLLPRGPYSTTQLYDESYSLGGIPAPLKETDMTMRHMLGVEKVLSKGYQVDKGTLDLMKGTAELASRKDVDYNLALEHVKRLSAKIRGRIGQTNEDAKKDEIYGVLTQIRGALMHDMDEAAKGSSGPVGEAVRESNKAWKEKVARDDLSYVIDKVGVKSSPGSNLFVIRPTKIKDWVISPDQRSWRASVGKERVEEFIQFLDDLAPYEKSLKGGLRFEAMKLGGGAGSLIGATIGNALAGPPWGTAAGAGIGGVSGTYLMEHLGDWFLSPKGQGVIKSLMKFSDGKWTSRETSALATAMIRTIGEDPLSDKIVKGIWEEQ